MAITIEVNEKTRQFDLHAVIEIDLMNIAQAELLSLTIKCLKSTTLIYLKALKSNKKILGNDRVRLIEKLDLLVTYLLLFFDSLNNNNELFSSDELNIGYTKMDIYIEISGNIDSSDYKSVINFNDSFNKN
ncbi:MAG: hypothetical protein PF693_05570, partial [Spirochaetia bacterium]|nr:hypothetical protein [Spirochaetia bacterium]